MASKRIEDLNQKSIATTSRANKPLNPGQLTMKELNNSQSSVQKICKFIYNSDKGTFCNRTFRSWAQIIAYFIIYLLILTTYTLIFLYGSLAIIKTVSVSGNSDSFDLIYSIENIGLTATPTSVDGYKLIWYRLGEADDYKRYVNAIEKLLVEHRMKRDVSNNLGPCGQPPYGYGDKPCIIVRINKSLRWAAKPLHSNSSLQHVPDEVKKWMKTDKKYWLHCSGYHLYDKEHIGAISYYPNPPGIDPKLFPMDMKKRSPLVGVQLSNFKIGISLSIECRLWYDSGVSSVSFLFFVMPKGKTLLRNHSHSHSRY